MKRTSSLRSWKVWTAVAASLALGGSLLYVRDARSLAPQNASADVRTAEGSESGLFARLGAFLGGGGGKSTAVAGRAPVSVLPVGAVIQNTPLYGSVMNPDEQKGRIVKLDRSGLKNWGRLQAGSSVLLPSLDGQPLEGVVNLRTEDNGWLRLGGSLAGGRGTFSLNTNSGDVAGFVLMPDTGIAYEIASDSAGDVLMVERRLGGVVCWPGSTPDAAAASTDYAGRANAASDPNSNVPISSGGVVPELNTRPGAKGLIYVDFDGETVTDNSWNGGQTIVAAPSNFTPDQIREIVARVAEDYAPFDITVTTVRALYDAAPLGMRMRTIVTPTTTAMPGAGGVAFISSWASAGKSFSSTIPAWVFNAGVKSAAEGISHEVGHTLGLHHDGTATSSYHSGNGSGATGWAPIMGLSYYQPLSQWSKGEYAGANNTEDDLAIIASAANGFGYLTPAAAGGVSPAGINLPIANGAFNVKGLLQRSTVPDVYVFATSGGALTASVVPAVLNYTNVDLQLELWDAAGNVLMTSNPVDALAASLSRDIPAGTYSLVVRSAGTGPRPSGGYTSGYSEYGSLGNYVLSGTLANVVAVPVITSPGAANGVVGSPFSFRVAASLGTLSISGTLPPGVSFDAATGVLGGTPTISGVWPLTVTASGATGSVSAALTVSIQDPVWPLSTVLSGVSSVSTSATAPWIGTSVVRADGQPGLVAVSGRIGNSASTTLGFQVPGGSTLGFYLKTSTEPIFDRVAVYVNGRLAVDADSGQGFVASGESDWAKRRVLIPGTGSQSVEIRYIKDVNLSRGQDRVWLYGLEITNPPVITKQPSGVQVRTNVGSFTLSATVTGATSYQWKKAGVSLVDGTVGSRVVSGANSAKLTVTGATPADSGVYVLEASNASGKALSQQVSVLVGGKPEFVQDLVAPVGLKVGDDLTLTVTATGSPQIYYLWVKNNSPIGRWTVDSTLQIRGVTASSAGKYRVIAVNNLGQVSSKEVTVTVAPAASAAPAVRAAR